MRVAKYLGNKYTLTILALAGSTVLFLPGRDYFAKGQWALLYLLVISMVARLGGVQPALLAALVSFFLWNLFFLPPYLTFYISDPKDWLSLVVFLIVGAVIGFQTGKMKDREETALAREQETALLNRFGAHLVSDVEVEEIAPILIAEILRATDAKCADLYLPDDQGKLSPNRSTAGMPCVDDEQTDQIVDWVFKNVKAVGLPGSFIESGTGTDQRPISASYEQAGFRSSKQDVFIPLQSASRVEGVLYVGEPSEYNEHIARVLVALVNQTAVFLERQRLRSEAILVDSLRESEKLKSVLISSVSHELKTPLSSATATVSNLLESDIKLDAASIKDELEAVRYDLDRLNISISSLIDLSLLETSTWTPRMESYEVGEIIATTLSKIPANQKNRISLSIPIDLPMIRVDFNQLERALQNLLENALLYSPDLSPVRIGASSTGKKIEIWVEDEGPGIPPEERKQVFNKLWRGESSSMAPLGTGLGMAIAKEIVDYHGGEILIEDAHPRGTRVIISLPNTAVVKETK